MRETGTGQQVARIRDRYTMMMMMMMKNRDKNCAVCYGKGETIQPKCKPIHSALCGMSVHFTTGHTK